MRKLSAPSISIRSAVSASRRAMVALSMGRVSANSINHLLAVTGRNTPREFSESFARYPNEGTRSWTVRGRELAQRYPAPLGGWSCGCAQWRALYLAIPRSPRLFHFVHDGCFLPAGPNRKGRLLDRDPGNETLLAKLRCGRRP